MALAIATDENWEVLQVHVQTAFLNANIQEDVYVKTPPGCGSVDAATGLPQVKKLKMSPYGQRQSSRNWFNTIDDPLKDMGFTSTTFDPCAYTFGTSETFSILTRCGLLLFGGNAPVLQELKRKLMNCFTMTDMGDVLLALGVQITRDREAVTLTISQEHCTKSILARLGMAVCNPMHATVSGAELLRISRTTSCKISQERNFTNSSLDL